MKKYCLCILVALCMVLAIVPMIPFTAGGVTVGDLTISGNTLTAGTDYTYENNVLTILSAKAITISGTTTKDRIAVAFGVSADLTLAGVNIDVSSDNNSCAFEIAENSTGTVTVMLADGTTNILKSGNYRAGLEKAGTNGSLTIRCAHSGESGHICDTTTCGVLEASSYNAQYSKYGSAAGIGSGSLSGASTDVSNITICGGNVTASSGAGAGIGSGYAGTSGAVSNITICGGNVTTSSINGAGIGSGSATYSGAVSNITISGGNVRSSDTSATGIGSGMGSRSGDVSNITISGGSFSASGNGGAGIGSGYATFSGAVSNITISGGSVTINISTNSPAIGSGYAPNKVGDVTNIIISGGSVKASGGVTDIGKGNSAGTPVTPTDGKGNNVYLCEIENAEGAVIMIDSIIYPSAHTYYDFDNSEWKTETNVYAYVRAGADVYVGASKNGTALDNSAMAFAVTDTDGAPAVHGKDYIYDNNTLTIVTARALTVKNTNVDATTGAPIATTDRIAVAFGVSADLTLAGVNIDVSSDNNSCAFEIAENSTGSVTVMLADGTTNILKSGSKRAGLEKAGTNGSLTIRCAHSGESGHICDTTTCGVLEASSYNAQYSKYGNGAGIGSGYDFTIGAVSNITICGGNVTTSSINGAGIGSGSASSTSGAVSNITISGGNVRSSDTSATGIGSGMGNNSGDVSNITISGGSFSASGVGGPGIGSGYASSISGAVSNITISGGSVTINISTNSPAIGSGRANSKAGDVTNIIISGGSVKASGGVTDIGKGNFAGTPVAPTDGKGNNVYLCDVANPTGAAVSINGKSYPAAHSYYDTNAAGEWKSETTIYPYLPAPTGGDLLTVNIGDDSLIKRFNSANNTFETVVAQLLSGTTVKGTYANIEDALAAASAGDTVKLLGNITITETINIDKKLTLDLNGYVLKRSGSGSVINISSGAELTLKDSNPNKKHKFTPNTNGLWVLDEASGTKTVKGGIITGGNAQNGGGVINSGTFTMQGGNIVGCTATENGGGVYNSYYDENNTRRAVLTMKNGTISGCTSGLHGGGVYNDYESTFTMEDGRIESCTTKNVGGGVFNALGTFTMQDGIITGCKATDNGGSYGGGVANDGSFTMVNGTISYCEAAYGGGVNNRPNATFLMKNGKIENCKAAYDGGGVANNGNIDEYATFTMENGTISACTAANNGGGVYNALDTFTMKNGTISNCSASLGGGVYNDYESTFTMEDGSISDCTATNGGGGGVYNNAIFTMKAGTITISGCKAVSGGGVQNMGGNFTMQGGTISDCSASLGGGGVNNAFSSTFTMKNGTISDCTSAAGGGVYNNGNFTIAGGKIDNCTATVNGSAVFQTTGNTTMFANGGSIIGNVFHQVMAGNNEALITRSDDATDYTTFTGMVSATNIDTKACPYTVTFDSKGGSAVATQYVLKGQAPKTVADPTKEHFNFKLWHTEGSTTAYNFSAVLTESVTLIADWECTGHSGTATCTSIAVCDYCGVEFGDVNKTNHSGVQVWTTRTETQHEHRWKCCGMLVVSLEPHEWQNGVCRECLYVCLHEASGSTCTGKTLCKYCGIEYGTGSSSSHTGEKVWTVKNETRHEQKWDCCGATVVALENHEWKNGSCSECGYTCLHKGGTSSCTGKRICEICGEEYGESSSSSHTGEKVWTVKDETQHEQKWDCCGATVVALENHEWKNGSCSECGYTCLHKGGTSSCTGKRICEICGIEYGEVGGKHELEHIGAKPATVNNEGNTEYWYCSACNGYFADKDGNTPIERKDTILPRLAPRIIEGMGQSVTEGEKKELSFRSDAAFDDFIRAEVDGKTLDESQYTKREGSTIVILNAEYIATLSAGEHTLGIVSTGGTATTTFTVEERVTPPSPSTGDNATALLLTLLILGGTASVMIKRKRKAVK